MDRGRSAGMVREDRAAGLPSVPGDPGRRHDEHRRGRPDRRHRRGRASDEALWMHVDGAYGGFFQLTDRGRERFRRDRAAPTASRSIPHKGLFLPYGTGASGRAGRRGAPRRAPRGRRLPPGPGADGRRCRTTTSTRPSSRASIRGLRVWLPLAAAWRGRVPRGARREARPDRRLAIGRSVPIPTWRSVGSAAHRRRRSASRALTTGRTAAVAGRGSTRPSACSCRARMIRDEYWSVPASCRTARTPIVWTSVPRSQ